MSLSDSDMVFDSQPLVRDEKSEHTLGPGESVSVHGAWLTALKRLLCILGLIRSASIL